MTRTRPSDSRNPDVSQGAGHRLDSSAVSGERDLTRLCQELEVHQIELETQNEELRRTRFEAERAFRRYSELFDFAPIGYFVLGGDATVHEVNLAAARLLGLERSRLQGRRLQLFLPEGQREAFSAFVRSTIQDVEPEAPARTSDFVLLKPDEQRLDVHVTASRLEGDAPAVLVAVEDVTRRKGAETALRDEARHKDEFLAALSHELRNPLAPIKNSLFILEHAEPGSEQSLRARAVIERQVTHLTNLVEDLLDVTRVARGVIHLQREPLDLGELVRRTVTDHQDTFDRMGVRLELRVDPEPLWVKADGTRLVQVLGNLLGNAAKFVSAQGRVEVELRREQNQAVLVVRDDGVGIAPDVLAHLFQPFRQAPQHLDRTRGGLGLGLAMVKGLVELHGGTVEASSAGLGRGAEFTVHLPLRACHPSSVPARETQGQRRHRVLVIEDTVDAAESLSEALTLNGHEVTVAYDGQTGLSLGRILRPSVVICDIGLPGMDGYQVARAMRGDTSFESTYLIALSGYAFAEDQERAADAGFDRHIAKPVDVESLERVLAQVSPS
jgi:PAS domain S-box-containing protein